MWSDKPIGSSGDLACPFCGLACDDLAAERDERGTPVVTSHGCRLAAQSFTETFGAAGAQASVRGRPAPLDAVIDHCAGLLRQARSPLFSGLATDVNGMRAALDLAERCGAHLDHMHGDALFRNLLVFQDSGWFTTTFTEVRNRADLILVVGTECFERFPRLRGRILFPPQSLFAPPDKRELVLIGPWQNAQVPAELAALKPTVVSVGLRELAGLIGILRGLIAHRPVRPDGVSGVAAQVLTGLADRLRTARYAVVAWAAAELDFPHAELTVQALVELVRDLNETTRAGVLPLAGTSGDVTVNQVCGWQTGYPPRTQLQRGRPRYDPILNRHQDLLARGESDLLLWISALSSEAAPPPTDVPTIVLGHPAMALAEPPEAYVPVGVPGIDHAGHWYRGDAVYPLPLGRLRDAGLPSVGRVLALIGGRL